MLARDVMSSPVITLRPDVPAHAAAALLVSHGFTAAPVVDPQRRVVGIATEADLVRGRIVPDGWAVDEHRNSGWSLARRGGQSRRKKAVKRLGLTTTRFQAGAGPVRDGAPHVVQPFV